MGEFALCVGRRSTVLGEKGTWDSPPKQQFSALPAHVDEQEEGTKPGVVHLPSVLWDPLSLKTASSKH